MIVVVTERAGARSRRGCARGAWPRTSRGRRRPASPRRSRPAPTSGAIADAQRSCAARLAADRQARARGSRRAAARRSSRACSSPVCGSRTANSSPPIRASTSVSRSALGRARARPPLISSSPALWPSVSLTSLRLSRSHTSRRRGRAVSLVRGDRAVQLLLEPTAVEQPGERVAFGVDAAARCSYSLAGSVMSSSWSTSCSGRPSAPLIAAPVER